MSADADVEACSRFEMTCIVALAAGYERCIARSDVSSERTVPGQKQAIRCRD